MEYPIEIDGKVYDFGVNRSALKKLNINNNMEENVSNSIEMIEQMFYAFLTVKNPEISYEEAMELLDKAEEEYGLEELSTALGKISEKGFTMNGKSKIAWLHK